MKTILFVLTFCCFANAVDSTTQGLHQGFLIKSELIYTVNGAEMKSHRELILSNKNRSWNTLVNAKDGIALLGKILRSDHKSIQVEYLLVDTNQANAVITTPSIMALLGEKTEISAKSDVLEFTVKLLATKTDYFSEN